MRTDTLPQKRRINRGIKMKLVKIVKEAKNIVTAGIISASVFTSPNVYAQAQKATPEQINEVKRIDNTTPSTQDNDEDWYAQQKLINSGLVDVLIQPVKEQPGYCIIGLDGCNKVYEISHCQKERTKNGQLELGELIVNFSQQDPKNKFYFPCDLKTPETPTVPNQEPTVPGPNGTGKKSKGKVSVGAGYLYVGTAKDEATQFDGNMHGGEVYITYNPKKGLPWFGVALDAYGSWNGLDHDLDVPAVDGPLAGKLVMKGMNEYSLQTIGLGANLLVGGDVYTNQSNTFGLGIEGLTGIMHDWRHHKFGESSAQYINGNVVEGSNISNHSDQIDSQFFMANRLGLRFRFGDFCFTPNAGFRTNFSAIYPVAGANLGYCPRQE